ncbi:MAG: PAS domain-containing protein, partial [Anaerolineae bacterium]|nr:PAS domain-containing protein [Anaerolineae bacterium]
VMTLVGIYGISRLTTLYRQATYIGIVLVTVTVYFQTLMRAYGPPTPYGTTAPLLWLAVVTLVAGLVISWRGLLLIGTINSIFILMLPQITGFLTLEQIRLPFEFLFTLSVLNILWAYLRERDAHRLEQETSQRKEAHDEAIKLRNQIITLFENVNYAFFSVDAATTQVTQISPACLKVYGRPPQEFYDDPAIWYRILHSDDAAILNEILSNLVPGQGKLAEFRIRLPDGQPQWIEAFFMPIYDANGKLISINGISANITDRKTSEAQRLELVAERQRSHVLRQFIDDASHDLRTPLATIFTSLFMLQRLVPPDLQLTRHLDTVNEQASHLRNSLDDLLLMSRLDDPDLGLDCRPLDIAQIIRDLHSHDLPQAEKQGIMLRLDVTSESVFISGHHDYLVRAIRNLVVNAFQHTPVGGTITLRVTCTGRDALIDVQDSGAGIPSEALPHIFDRFFRAEKARSTHTGRIGLGLPLTGRIVELHGGQISVQSSLGSGSLFRICLPLLQ